MGKFQAGMLVRRGAGGCYWLLGVVGGVLGMAAIGIVLLLGLISDWVFGE